MISDTIALGAHICCKRSHHYASSLQRKTWRPGASAPDIVKPIQIRMHSQKGCCFSIWCIHRPQKCVTANCTSRLRRTALIGGTARVESRSFRSLQSTRDPQPPAQNEQSCRESHEKVSHHHFQLVMWLQIVKPQRPFIGSERGGLEAHPKLWRSFRMASRDGTPPPNCSEPTRG